MIIGQCRSLTSGNLFYVWGLLVLFRVALNVESIKKSFGRIYSTFDFFRHCQEKMIFLFWSSNINSLDFFLHLLLNSQTSWPERRGPYKNGCLTVQRKQSSWIGSTFSKPRLAAKRKSRNVLNKQPWVPLRNKVETQLWFPSLDTSSLFFTVSKIYTFSRPWHWLHVFPLISWWGTLVFPPEYL